MRITWIQPTMAVMMTMKAVRNVLKHLFVHLKSEPKHIRSGVWLDLARLLECNKSNQVHHSNFRTMFFDK